MWDVHLEAWTARALAAGLNVRHTDISAALDQVTIGNATGSPAGAPVGPGSVWCGDSR